MNGIRYYPNFGSVRTVNFTCDVYSNDTRSVFPDCAFNSDVITVGKHTPCKLSFEYTSQVKLTVRTEPIWIISDAYHVSYFEL